MILILFALTALFAVTGAACLIYGAWETRVLDRLEAELDAERRRCRSHVRLLDEVER